MSNLRIPLLNEVRIAGRIGHTPELRETKAGVSVLTFSVAYQYKKEETHWFDCQAWGDVAEEANRELDKGMPVLVFGNLVQREYKPRDSDKKLKKVEVRAWKILPLQWPDEPEEKPARASEPEDDIPF